MTSSGHCHPRNQCHWFNRWGGTSGGPCYGYHLDERSGMHNGDDWSDGSYSNRWQGEDNDKKIEQGGRKKQVRYFRAQPWGLSGSGYVEEVGWGPEVASAVEDKYGDNESAWEEMGVFSRHLRSLASGGKTVEGLPPRINAMIEEGSDLDSEFQRNRISRWKVWVQQQQDDSEPTCNCSTSSTGGFVKEEAGNLGDHDNWNGWLLSDIQAQLYGTEKVRRNTGGRFVNSLSKRRRCLCLADGTSSGHHADEDVDSPLQLQPNVMDAEGSKGGIYECLLPEKGYKRPCTMASSKPSQMPQPHGQVDGSSCGPRMEGAGDPLSLMEDQGGNQACYNDAVGDWNDEMVCVNSAAAGSNFPAAAISWPEPVVLSEDIQQSETRRNQQAMNAVNFVASEREIDASVKLAPSKATDGKESDSHGGTGMAKSVVDGSDYLGSYGELPQRETLNLRGEMDNERMGGFDYLGPCRELLETETGSLRGEVDDQHDIPMEAIVVNTDVSSFCRQSGNTMKDSEDILAESGGCSDLSDGPHVPRSARTMPVRIRGSVRKSVDARNRDHNFNSWRVGEVLHLSRDEDHAFKKWVKDFRRDDFAMVIFDYTDELGRQGNWRSLHTHKDWKTCSPQRRKYGDEKYSKGANTEWCADGLAYESDKHEKVTSSVEIDEGCVHRSSHVKGCVKGTLSIAGREKKNGLPVDFRQHSDWCGGRETMYRDEMNENITGKDDGSCGFMAAAAANEDDVRWRHGDVEVDSWHLATVRKQCYPGADPGAVGRAKEVSVKWPTLKLSGLNGAEANQGGEVVETEEGGVEYVEAGSQFFVERERNNALWGEKHESEEEVITEGEGNGKDIDEAGKFHARNRASGGTGGRGRGRCAEKKMVPRRCFICKLKMVKGDRVAALMNIRVGQLVCSSRNRSGKFHVFHSKCLNEWISLCEAKSVLTSIAITAEEQDDGWSLDGRSDRGMSVTNKEPLSSRVPWTAGRVPGTLHSLNDDGLTHAVDNDGNPAAEDPSIYTPFCPECQGTGHLPGNGELEHPCYRLQQVYEWNVEALLLQKVYASDNNQGSDARDSALGKGSCLSPSLPRLSNVQRQAIHFSQCTRMRFHAGSPELLAALAHAGGGLQG